MLARTFERTFSTQRVSNGSTRETATYIEANILADPRYADGAVKMFVGAFHALFGSPRGALLRQWAAARGVALTWAIGTGAHLHDHEELLFCR